MKKFYFILVFFMVLWPAVTFAQVDIDTWDGTATSWTNGLGTETDPYLIESAEHLAFLAEKVMEGTEYEGKYFKLTTDLDLDNRPWTPIGGRNNYSRIFQGTFDGSNYIIDNLQCDVDG